MSAHPATPGSLRIIAHRGYSARAPENTLASLRLALEAGADAVEWDIHTAACGTPVLFHDPHLGRTTNGVGPVRRRTASQLRALDAGSWFSSEFAGEPIPTLAEAFELVRDRAEVVAEVKGWREMEDIDRMVRVTSEAGMTGRTLFIAMDWNVLDRAARVEPGLRIAYIVERPERFDEALERARGRERAGLAVDYRFLLADPERASRAREAGLDTGVWTVNDPADAERLRQLGIRDFTTDRVEDLLRWREGLKG